MNSNYNTSVSSLPAEDYLWLLDRGYPDGPSLKLIGDRYRLGRSKRNILRRGISPSSEAGARRVLLTRDVRERSLAVDGHNVLLTIANYLAGRPVFLANDGLLRDDGALHGRVHNSDVMNHSVDLLRDALTASRAASVCIVLDRPVSHSGELAGAIRVALGPGFAGRLAVRLEDSADGALRRADAEVISSADSAVIDAAGKPIYDLARHSLEAAFGFVPQPASDLLQRPAKG